MQVENLIDVQETLDECGFTIEATKRMLDVAKTRKVDSQERRELLRDCVTNLQYARQDVELARRGLNMDTVLH